MAADCLAEIEKLFPESGASAGLRLKSLSYAASHLASDGAIGREVAEILGSAARPVRAIAFDKSSEVNWALGWHQDRTICVQHKAEAAGFGSWTEKQGLPHVEPPFELLSRMVTIRVHIDPVTAGSGPLRIALGTHTLGLIVESSIDDTVAGHEELTCLADRGDVWFYATPILHASDRSHSTERRRVLQIDYSADNLPEPLAWIDL